MVPFMLLPPCLPSRATQYCYFILFIFFIIFLFYFLSYFYFIILYHLIFLFIFIFYRPIFVTAYLPSFQIYPVLLFSVWCARRKAFGAK